MRLQSGKAMSEGPESQAAGEASVHLCAKVCLSDLELTEPPKARTVCRRDFASGPEVANSKAETVDGE